MLSYYSIDWNSVNLLEIVEAYAEAQCYAQLETIHNEESLSELFDQYHEKWLCRHRDDQIMIDEEFNNWTDMLREDGEIHPEQYDKYVYVGKYCE